MSTPDSAPRKSPWPWIIGFGCGLPILAIGGCFVATGLFIKKVADDPEVKKSLKEMENISKDQSAEKLELDSKNIKFKRDDAYIVHVTGTIKNKSAGSLPYVQFKVEGLDKEGNRVNEALTTTTDLGPGKTWKFDAMIPDTNKQIVKLGDYKMSTTPFQQ